MHDVPTAGRMQISNGIGRCGIPHVDTLGGSSSVVEHNLAKVGVAGSNPVFRSTSLPVVCECALPTAVSLSQVRTS